MKTDFEIPKNCGLRQTIGDIVKRVDELFKAHGSWMPEYIYNYIKNNAADFALSFNI